MTTGTHHPQRDPCCRTCGYVPRPNKPAGENDAWQCSHIACPHRHRITAAPGDRVPAPKD